MALRANYFKLGLFVIGAVVAAVLLLIIIGSGRIFQQKITIETYFNESVQGLDTGSKVKYRGVVIGEVTTISFTYTKYQQDKPMTERLRYVLIEAQLQPKLLGGKAAGELTNAANIQAEVERGLRVKSSPQGITGTNYLEIDYVEPPPPLLPIDWTPDHPYIPSTPSTVTALVNAASEIMEHLRKLDIEGTLANFNRLMTTTNTRIEQLDTRALTDQSTRVLAKLERAIDNLQTKKLSDESLALITDLRATSNELKKTLANPAFQTLPDEAAAAIARVRAVVDDPNLPLAFANLSRATGRLNRAMGLSEHDLTITIQNLRQITDNLRDLTEETKRYPANVLFGQPPTPSEHVR